MGEDHDRDTPAAPAAPTVQNPLYKGATPEDVGRALLQPSEDLPDTEPESEGSEAA